MPPKSSKSHILFNCNVCNCTILAKEAKTHEFQSCPCSSVEWVSPYIKEGVLYTNLEEQLECLQEISIWFVYLSPLAMNTAGFIIGDPVEIVCADGSLPTIVRRVYPKMTTNSLIATAVRKTLDPKWHTDSAKIIIKKLSSKVIYADSIAVTSLESQYVNSPDFRSYLRLTQRNRIISCTNSIQIDYFGKNIVLRDLKITPQQDADSWFLITNDTTWVFENDEKTSDKIANLSIGGVQTAINEIQSFMKIAFRDAPNTKINPIKCALLFGHSGVGKSMICRYIASKSGKYVVNINGSEIFSNLLGETEASLKKMFENAEKNQPALVIIDDIDTICSKLSTRTTEQQKRILSTFINMLENLHQSKTKMFVLSTTNKPDKIDPSLRRYGLIDTEIEIPIPTEKDRLEIMKNICSALQNNLTHDEIIKISKLCHGFVGADLANLCSKAMTHALTTDENVSNVTYADFEYALNHVKPSVMREIILDVPNVKWSDIGGQEDLKLKLKQSIEWPLTHNSSFTRLGIKPPSGVLMYGPPGCSKTMIAKALATESGLNFLSIKGPEVFSMWVGESEKAVRDLFSKGRQLSPSIIFFDEIDALGGERSNDQGGSNVQERVLAQILTELDGITPLSNVTVVAATNRPDKIDSALLRPGRLDRLVYVPLPDKETRLSIFKIKLSRMTLDHNILVEDLVERTEGYSGAEIEAVCQEAGLKALEEDVQAPCIFLRHFDIALHNVSPRTPSNLLELYDKFKGLQLSS